MTKEQLERGKSLKFSIDRLNEHLSEFDELLYRNGKCLSLYDNYHNDRDSVDILALIHELLPMDMNYFTSSYKKNVEDRIKELEDEFADL